MINKSLFILFCLLNSFAGFGQKDSTIKKPTKAEVVLTNDSKVRLTPPMYFVPSERMDSYVHSGAAAAIQINKTHGHPYPVMADAMTKNAFLEKAGITLISKENIKTDQGKDAILIVSKYTINTMGQSLEYERIILLSGDYETTYMVNANYPVVARNILFEVIKKSVLTLTY